MTLLVVDDEPLVRMLVDEALREHHIQTLEATDATTALQVLESTTPLDLLIADVGLPGEFTALAGVEVLAKPFTLERLLAQIDLLLDERGNRPPA